MSFLEECLNLTAEQVRKLEPDILPKLDSFVEANRRQLLADNDGNRHCREYQRIEALQTILSMVRREREQNNGRTLPKEVAQ